MIKLDKL